MNYKSELKQIASMLRQCVMLEQVRKVSKSVVAGETKVIDTKTMRRYNKYSSQYDLLILCKDLDVQDKIYRKAQSEGMNVDKITDNLVGFYKVWTEGNVLKYSRDKNLWPVDFWNELQTGQCIVQELKSPIGTFDAVCQVQKGRICKRGSIKEIVDFLNENNIPVIEGI